MTAYTKKIGDHAFRIEVYRGKNGDWYWRGVSQANGKTVAGGLEGFRRPKATATRARRFAGPWPIVVVQKDGSRYHALGYETARP